jgi:hypothetical protein
MASVPYLGRFKKGENMKRVVLMWVILLGLVSTPLSAQVNEDTGKTLDAMQKEKDAIIGNEMKLTEPEKNGFWPLYKEYQEALRKVQGRSFKLISEYAEEKEKDTFSDEKAKVLLKEYLDIERERLELKNAYVQKFGKILPPKKVMRYFQLENKIEANLIYQLSRLVPLAK